MNTTSSSWKQKLEQSFGKLGASIYKHPWIWFLANTLIVFALASQLVHLKQDTSMEGFLNKGAPEIQLYNEFKDTFGKDELFLITIEVDELFDQEFIDLLRDFHVQLEDEVPYVDRVDSLVNARYTYGEEDTMYIEDLLPKVLPEGEALQNLKDYISNSDSYRNWLISEDGNMLVVAVKLAAFLYEKDEAGNTVTSYIEDVELGQALAKIEEVIDQYEGKLSPDIRVSGSIPVAINLASMMERDFGVFTVLAIVLIGSILYVIFRRLSGVVMPMIIMALGIVTTISMMAIQSVPMQVTTSILPSFLLAVCVGDSIHLLTIFYRKYDLGLSKVDALIAAMEHTGLAIFFTSITTAAGLASFAFSEIFPVASLGYYGAMGSIIAFLLTIFILPTLISILPLKRNPLKEDNERMHHFLMWFANLSIAKPKQIVAVGAFLVVSSLYFISQLGFSHAPVTWLEDDDELKLAIDNFTEHMGGSLALEVVFDTGSERGINDQAFLKELAKAQEEISTWEEETFKVVKVMAVTDIVRESNRALNANDEVFYRIPDDSELISQELFLVELDKPDDLFQMIDTRYQLARLTILIPMVDAVHLPQFLTRVDDYLQQNFNLEEISYYHTGVMSVLGSTFAKMLYSTAQSYGLAAIAITIMMILLIGSLKLGLISMMPSLLPIFIVLACVYLLGAPLDILTMLVGSIAIGLTVDDNVHFMHGFRRVYNETGDPEKAIVDTLLSTGRAMLITSIVLSTGFFIYTQSAMTNMRLFGLVTALCIILALLATFLLAPALMMLSNKNQSLDRA